MEYLGPRRTDGRTGRFTKSGILSAMSPASLMLWRRAAFRSIGLPCLRTADACGQCNKKVGAVDPIGPRLRLGQARFVTLLQGPPALVGYVGMVGSLTPTREKRQVIVFGKLGIWVPTNPPYQPNPRRRIRRRARYVSMSHIMTPWYVPIMRTRRPPTMRSLWFLK
jgi:hypothetical protein